MGNGRNTHSVCESMGTLINIHRDNLWNIYLFGFQRMVVVPAHQLSPTVPRRGDRVIVTRQRPCTRDTKTINKHLGALGVMVKESPCPRAVPHAYVKLDDIQMTIEMPLFCLGKYRPNLNLQ